MWLPRDIPPAIRLLPSTVPGKALEDFAQRGWSRMDVEPLTVREREQLTVRVLDATRQTAGPVTGCTPCFGSADRHSRLPLSIVEELHPRRPRYFNSGWTTICTHPVSQSFTKRFWNGMNTIMNVNDQASVRDSMSYLWAARRGLSESELLIGLELGNNHYHRHYGHRSTLPLTGC